MARANIKTNDDRTTNGGAIGEVISAELQLRRSVLSCLLWEDNFYESGETIAARIDRLANDVPVETVIELAKEARHKQHLRHVSLQLLLAVIRRGKGKMVSDAIYDVVSRADEMAELVALYRKDNARRPLSAQLKLGIARCFEKFSAEQLAKYNRDGKIKLRTLLNTCRPIPANAERAAIYKAILDDNLPSPQTWEVMLSGGADKQKTFTTLLQEKKLGYLALIRNLRNMEQSGVDRALVESAILARAGGADKVLPFRFVAARNAAPSFKAALQTAMIGNLADAPKLKGRTVVIVDVSGSMGANLSVKSDMNRMVAAQSLAMILQEVCEESAIYATAGNDGTRVHATALVPNAHGFDLFDKFAEVQRKVGHGGIFLKQVMDFIHDAEKGNQITRVIVITDEQDCARHPEDMPTNAKILGEKNYMINVGNNKIGIGYKSWTHIDGFSEAVVQFMIESEAAGI